MPCACTYTSTLSTAHDVMQCVYIYICVCIEMRIDISYTYVQCMYTPHFIHCQVPQLVHPHIKALLRGPVQVSAICLCHLRSLGPTPPNHQYVYIYIYMHVTYKCVYIQMQTGQFEPPIIQLFKDMPVGNVLEVLYQVCSPLALRWATFFHGRSQIPIA